MKRAFLFLAVMLAMCQLMAVDPSDLPKDKRDDYFRKALSIDVGSQTNTTSVANAYNIGYGISTAVGHGSSESFTVWTPYRGAFPIGRVDFFQTVGETGLAEETRIFEEERAKDKKTAMVLGCTGAAIAGVGLVIELLPLVFNDYSDAGSNVMFAGLGIALGGCTLLCVAIPFESRSKETQSISAEFVIGLANSYNQRLLESY